LRRACEARRNERFRRSALSLPAPAGISRSTNVIFAVAAGVAVANIYYLQPILAVIATSLHATPREVGYVSVALQIGYALGILAFVPLGDIMERRRLIVTLFAVTTICLACAASAPTIVLLALALCAVGITTTAPQILQPFAADLALPTKRGSVLGIMQTGLIVGTVFARALSGVLGAYASWRDVFAFAAALSAVSAVILARVIPLHDRPIRLRYRDLFASLPAFIVALPTLRASMAIGFLAFTVFTGVWTVLAFHVREMGYASDVVGFLGLVSIFGAFSAGSIGKLTDRRGTVATGGIGWLLTTLSFLIFLITGHNIYALGAAMVLFAIGAQGSQISNQARVFAISDDARSRLNTIYMFSMYSGGAYGSFVFAWVYQESGWTGVCIAGLAHLMVMGGVLLWLRTLPVKRAVPAA
jgi:predicted MFS family arabinose efflux permease